MRILGSIIILITIASCKFQDIKVDRYFSRTINESQKNDLLVFEMMESNLENPEEFIDFCWVEKKARYKAGFLQYVDVEPGFGLHIKYKFPVKDLDKLQLLDLDSGNYFDQWMTYGEEESNRVYFIDTISQRYFFAIVINGDTLGKILLEKK